VAGLVTIIGRGFGVHTTRYFPTFARYFVCVVRAPSMGNRLAILRGLLCP